MERREGERERERESEKGGEERMGGMCQSENIFEEKKERDGERERDR